MSEQTTMHLEFWLPKGRKGGAWIQIPDPVPGLYKTWRKVFDGHSHKDKLPHSIAVSSASQAPTRTRAQVCEEYCAWARHNGVRPTIYADDVGRRSREAARAAYYDVDALRAVPVAEFIGPAPAPEICHDED